MVRRLVRQSGRPTSVSLAQVHHDPTAWRYLLGLVEAAAAEGLPIRAQVAPRPIGTLRVPIGRGATWARTGSPSSAAPSTSPSRYATRSGRCAPAPATARWAGPSPPNQPPHHGELLSGPGESKSEISSKTPPPRPPVPAGSRAARLRGRQRRVGSPRLVRWFRVREVVKPTAPAALASAASRAICAMSSRSPASGAPRVRPSRRCAAPRGAAGRRSRCRAARVSSASRYSGSSPIPRGAPRASAAPGMSSTPSITSTSRSRVRGRDRARSRRRNCPSPRWSPRASEEGARRAAQAPARRNGCGCRRSRA